VAFWRGFVQVIAKALDEHGADGLRTFLQSRINDDDAALPGHMRAAGALRQNRAAWLLLSGWLQQAGYLSEAERATLDAAHLQARVSLAAKQEAQQRQNRPATIFLQLVDSLQLQGYVIEQKEMRCPECGGPMHKEITGWHCGNDTIGGDSRGVCHYRIAPDRLLGFHTASGRHIGLNIEHCWALAQDMRRRQGQPLRFSQQAVLQQLDNDGLIARTDGRNGYTVKARNPANNSELQRCLLLHAAALDTGDTPGDEGSGGRPDTDSQGDERGGGAGEPAPAPVPAPQPDYAAMSPLQRAMLVDSQQPAECTSCTQHVPGTCEQPGTCSTASQSDKEGHVPDVPDVPGTNTYIQPDSPQEGEEQPAPMNAYAPGTSGTSGTWGDMQQQEATKHVPGTCEQPGTWGNYLVHGAAPSQPGPDSQSAAPRQPDELRGAAPQDTPAQPEGDSQADELPHGAGGQAGSRRTIRMPRRVEPAQPAQQQEVDEERLADSDIRLPHGWELTWSSSRAFWEARNPDTGQRTRAHKRTRQGRAALLQDIRDAERQAERGAA
jgi:hypothetical protein